MFMSLSTLLHVLAATSVSIPFVAAQTTDAEITAITDELYAKIPSTVAPAPGFNVDGGSVFTNFARAFKDKQFFLIMSGSSVFEKPKSEPLIYTMLIWCSDLTFSDISNSSLMGYAARCVDMFLAGHADLVAAGGQLTFDYSKGKFTSTLGISAVFGEKLNVFQGQYHRNTDDWVVRYWDDGLKSMPVLGWEGHEEGDMGANAATASWSGFGENTWMSVEEVAQLFNTSTDEFTPDKFKQVYKDTWIKDHEAQAKIQTGTAEAALKIIDEVKNETDSADEIATPPAQPDSDSTEEADGGTEPIDDSASGRKLASVAARLASAALRVFGI